MDEGFLNDLIQQAKADDKEAVDRDAAEAMRRVAGSIAAFYGGLIESGIPEPIAVKLAIEFTRMFMNVMATNIIRNPGRGQ